MNTRSRTVAYSLIAVLWATAVVVGAVRLWAYDSTPGASAPAPASWPAGAHVARVAGLPTLVLALHPHCPCSRATVGELARLMTDCNGKVRASVLFLRPPGVPGGWERTGLWSDAAAIPGVTVVADDGGAELRRFGATTSGQTLLYSPEGRLLFAGGITESRGHGGDNAGRSAVTAIVLGAAPAPDAPAHTPVYGCSLSDGPSTCQKKGSDPCPR